jgi:hypothetical protein
MDQQFEHEDGTPDGIAERRCAGATEAAWRWAERAKQAMDSVSPVCPSSLKEPVEDAWATADALADDAGSASVHGDFARAEQAMIGAAGAARDAIAGALKAATWALHEMDARVARLERGDPYSSIGIARRQQQDAEQAVLARIRACKTPAIETDVPYGRADVRRHFDKED